MEFRQELSNSIGGDCKGDSRSHLQCIYANHITILAGEEMSFSHQVVQTEHIGGSEVSPLGQGTEGLAEKWASSVQINGCYLRVGRIVEGTYMCKFLWRNFKKNLELIFPLPNYSDFIYIFNMSLL